MFLFVSQVRHENESPAHHACPSIHFGLTAFLLVTALLLQGLPIARNGDRVYASAPYLTLISRSTSTNTLVPAFASSGTATSGNSSDYSSFWSADSVPAWLAYDLSSVPASQRTQVVVAWYNDPITSDYWQGGGIGNSYYNLPQNYTIDGNAAPGGTSAPTSGWVTLVTVSSNAYAGRMNPVNLSGYNWVRMNITASRGGPPAINVDIYDASQGMNDTFLMLGDSITAEGMAHSNIDLSGPWNGGNLTQLINAANQSYYPSIIDGGTGGVTAQWGATYISSLLAPYSGHFVALNYGSNDANQSGALSSQQISSYYTNLLTMVDAVQARGMVPIVPHIPWGCASSGWLGINAKTLNNYVDAHLYSDRQGVIKGPDLWTFFYNHQNLLSDCLHPTYTESGDQLSGYEQYQRQWRDALLANVYGAASSSLPAVTLSATAVSFGTQPVSTASTRQTVTLTNSGTAPMTISSISITGTNAADFAQTNTCSVSPGTLTAGSSCTISVTFTPSATGSRTANVSIADNASGSPHSIALSGTGTAPAVTLAPTSLTFASQPTGTTSAAQSITLTNSGNAALTISSIGLTGTNAGDFAQTTTCPISPSTLAANGVCTISVTFTPTATGSRTASVSITDRASGSPHSVSLSGTGTAPAPVVSMNPTSLSFANQVITGTSAPKTVTLANSGNAALTLTSISIIGTNSADFAQTNTCPVSPSTLAANGACTISVTFTPGATGSRSASVSVSDNAIGSPHSVSLSGTGTTASPTVSLMGSATASGDFSGGIALKVPAAATAGDLLIAVAGSNGTPASWTTPTGWTAGTNSAHPDGQGLNWWWKVATASDAGTSVTLKASDFADGGAELLDYRGLSASSPILGVSTMATNDNGGVGNVTKPTFTSVSWSGSTSVVSLLLMSWQPNPATVTWSTGVALQATANDGFDSVAAGANLTPQTATSLASQTATLSQASDIIPTLQVALRVGP